MTESDPGEASSTASRLYPYILLVLICTVPLMLLGVFAQRVASDAMETQIRDTNRSAATVTARLIETEFEYWTNTLQSFARLPMVVDRVKARDEEFMRDRLEILVEANPRLVRAFVTDDTALLWTDFPQAPESLGKRFHERDWYIGTSKEWKPYVSQVYRRNASPPLLLVAIAVPVRDLETGRVIGVLVGQVQLETLTELLRKVEVGSDGHVIVLDSGRNVAAHPSLDLQAEVHADYAEVDPVRTPDGVVAPYEDPVSGVEMLASSATAVVPGGDWLVVAQQPADSARAALRAMSLQILFAGLLLLMGASALAVFLARDRLQTRRLNDRLRDLNSALDKENTVRLKAEEELKRANDQLEQRVDERTRELRSTEDKLTHAQKMEAVGRLAGGVAHDFNNLLSVIIGYAQFAQEGLPGDSPLRADIEEIRQAGERAAGLTRQLLAFSRKQVLQPVVLDINEAVARMDKMLRRLLGEDVEFQTRLAADIGRTRADPGQLEQVVVNLAINARDAMPSGGKLTIETGNADLDENYIADHPEAKVGPHVYFAISDTGVGMDAATKAKIFEPFFTTKEMGRGTGLGLSTVYGIIKQSGGNIWVYSEPGRGTTFKVYLPRVEDASKPKAAQAPKEANRGTETILVLEDEPGVRRLAVQVLGSAGYTVLAAENAEQALELFKANQDKLALLLTDVVLPGTGGPALARQLQAIQPGLKVLFMSGYTDNAIVHHGVLDAGVNFLEKPLRPDVLLKKVRETIDESRGSERRSE